MVMVMVAVVAVAVVTTVKINSESGQLPGNPSSSALPPSLPPSLPPLINPYSYQTHYSYSIPYREKSIPSM